MFRTAYVWRWNRMTSNSCHVFAGGGRRILSCLWLRRPRCRVRRLATGFFLMTCLSVSAIATTQTRDWCPRVMTDSRILMDSAVPCNGALWLQLKVTFTSTYNRSNPGLSRLACGYPDICQESFTCDGIMGMVFYRHSWLQSDRHIFKTNIHIYGY